MPISTECPECGKRLKAPDSAAGRKAKCPQCGAAVPIPEPVYDAEEVFDAEIAGDEETVYESEDEHRYRLGQAPSRPPVPASDRRSCPMCGEMIKASAVKCRYCGEVFDESLKGVGGHVDSDLIRRFRRETNGIAGLWIAYGVLFFLTALAYGFSDQFRGANPDAASIVASISMIIAILLFVVGICGFLKLLWAIYTGLVASYLIAFLFVIGMINAAAQQPGSAVCSVFLLLGLVFAIIQGHRVIGFANQLRRAGVALSALP